MLLSESPIWLLRKERKEDAEKSLKWLKGEDFKVEAEISELELAIEANNAKEGMSKVRKQNNNKIKVRLFIEKILFREKFA